MKKWILFEEITGQQVSCLFFGNFLEYSRIFFKNQKVHRSKLMVFGSGFAHHGFLVREDGCVFGFGKNEEFELGLGENCVNYRLRLVKFFSSKNITKISCGDEFSIFLVKNQIYAVGSNKYGQLGFEFDSNIKNNLFMNYCRKSPALTEIKFENRVVDIVDCFVGIGHTFVLSKKLEVYSFGKNDEGQLGVGHVKNLYTAGKVKINEKIISISPGGHFSCFISIEGKSIFLNNILLLGNVWVCGQNSDGQLGFKSDKNLESLNNSYEYSNNVQTPEKLFFKKKTIISVSCGWYHCLFLTSDNQVFSTGYNVNGELGVGDEKSKTIPCLNPFSLKKSIIALKCGAGHSCFISDNEIWMSGLNDNGQIGNQDKEGEKVLSPVLVSIKGKKIIQSLLLYCSSIHFTKNEVYGSGCSVDGELFYIDKDGELLCGNTENKRKLFSQITNKERRKNPKIIKLCNFKVKKFAKGSNTARERFEYLMDVQKKFEIVI